MDKFDPIVFLHGKKTLGKKRQQTREKIFATHLTKSWFPYYIVSSYEKIRKMVKR